MPRYSSKDIIEVGRLITGTSAQFIGVNSKTGKKGIYKQNSCNLGIDNDDIREKLSSAILHSLNISSADIDLVYDEENNQNCYFSNYIIEDNEELVVPDEMDCESNLENPIDNMCDRYVQAICKLTNDGNLIEEAKKNFYNYTYMCCILDCYDIKPDNLPLVYNKDTDKLSVAPWFDFGTAFCKEHKSAAISNMSTAEMLDSLYANNYTYIEEISKRVNSELTPEKINEMMSSDYVLESLNEEQIEQIKARLLSQVAKSKELQISKEQLTKGKENGFLTIFKNIKNRISSIFNNRKNIKALNGQIDSSYEDKEKLAALGYSSVAEMNADDKEAEMFKILNENKYPPEDVIAYDESYKETSNIEQEKTI